MTLAAGQSLTHYEILEPIGAGAMGEVWRARDTKLGRSVIFCSGKGHLGMGIARLELEPPTAGDRLPRAVGEPVDIVRPEGVWHVHNANWSPDGERVAFVHDADRATIFMLPSEATLGH